MKMSPYSPYTGSTGGLLQLRAVIFDYGMVLSGPPDSTIQARLIQLSGLSPALAESLYWKHRRYYDQGILSGLEYWRTIFNEAGVDKSAEQIAELAALDARMWTTYAPALVHWQAQLKQAGIQTAILSNIGDLVKESIVGTFPWVQNFDVLVWSYQLRLLKPDPAIFHYALKQLGVEPAQALFIDDIEENVVAAKAMGIETVLYQGIAALCDRLHELNLDPSFPYPATC